MLNTFKEWLDSFFLNKEATKDKNKDKVEGWQVKNTRMKKAANIQHEQPSEEKRRAKKRRRERGGSNNNNISKHTFSFLAHFSKSDPEHKKSKPRGSRVKQQRTAAFINDGAPKVEQGILKASNGHALDWE